LRLPLQGNFLLVHEREAPTTRAHPRFFPSASQVPFRIPEERCGVSARRRAARPHVFERRLRSSAR
jgi:hypothetical protein